ncbi:MAG: glycoside hydrolase family 88 protein [Bacteroidota bacterium]
MRSFYLLFFLLFSFNLLAQKGNDVTTPLHAMKVDYPTPYAPPKTEDVKKVLDKLFNYLDAVTPTGFVNRKSGDAVSIDAVDTNTIVKPGDFRLTSYEWGVTYSGMLEVGAATGDKKFTDYAKSRTEFIFNSLPPFKKLHQQYGRKGNPFAQPIAPHALDDAGAVCAAMIKAQRAGVTTSLRPLIDDYMNYVFTKEFRFADGTIARNRPHKNTLWLDDLYMAIPAIAQMGKLTGDKKYYDDAVKQVEKYSSRMFNKEMNVYMHGWVEEMKVHPEFHWARANGWAIMAMVELLDVLPTTHPGYGKVLQQLQAHAKGLAAYQTPQGFWHQLLEKNDSYLETSATAIYAYCFARGINKGWLDAKAYAPAALLAWNAVATKVNDKGQVEGTCVGTGMAFDPAFYYYRPVNVFAAHGYGPALLAGAEITTLLKNFEFEMNDSALQLKSKK